MEWKAGMRNQVCTYRHGFMHPADFCGSVVDEEEMTQVGNIATIREAVTGERLQDELAL